jgi:hypothetical protein
MTLRRTLSEGTTPKTHPLTWPPSRQARGYRSGRPDSNRRRPAWGGDGARWRPAATSVNQPLNSPAPLTGRWPALRCLLPGTLPQEDGLVAAAPAGTRRGRRCRDPDAGELAPLRDHAPPVRVLVRVRNDARGYSVLDADVAHRGMPGEGAQRDSRRADRYPGLTCP